MTTLYWISLVARIFDMKILRPCMNNVHTLQRRVKYRNLSDMRRSTLLRSMRRGTVCSYTESANSYITVLMCEQKLYPMRLSCQQRFFRLLDFGCTARERLCMNWLRFWGACAACCEDIVSSPGFSKSLVLATVGSVMTIGLSINGCTHSKKKKRFDER